MVIFHSYVSLPEGRTLNVGHYISSRLRPTHKANMFHQWPFQDPRLEVPTLYKAYVSGLNFREYPQNSYGQKNMVLS